MSLVDKLIIVLLTAVFWFAGVDKIFHFEGFVNALRNYVLVPAGAAPFIAVPIIGVELLVGLGLLLRPWRSAAAFTGACTLALFTAALAINHLYGDRSVCGCWFTITLAKSTSMHIVQNLTMLGLFLMVWWQSRELPGDGDQDRQTSVSHPNMETTPARI